MQVSNWPLSRIVPYPKNARKIPQKAIDKVAASIAEYGWQQPIVVDAAGVIIVGHTRLLAAIKLKLTEAPVLVADKLTAKQVRAYRLMDNRSHEETQWDYDLLGLELVDLKDIDMSLTGFDFPEMEKLMAGPQDDAAENAVPDLQSGAVSTLGDVWLCGPHRVCCGDSTDVNATQTATGAALGLLRANLMVTDPPYGVDYDAKWRLDRGLNRIHQKRAEGKVSNDDRADWREAYKLFTGAVCYVWHASLHIDEAIASIESAGFIRRSLIIWAKQALQISRGHYHWQHESCWYAVRGGASATWRGDRKQSTLWSIPNVHATQGTQDDGKNAHSTQKPLECMRRPMLNHTKRGEAVYDPFLGSGTTLIACEQSERICYGIEINPLYVDLVVRRWEKFSGKQATLEGDKRTFIEIEKHRHGKARSKKNSD